MSQHDFNIANQSFPATRTDLNNALLALASNSSGDAEPGTTYANQWWYETDTNKLKIRNEANNAWIEVATLDQSSSNVLSITTQGLTLGATALTATGTELNQLDAITRGSILYGNASGATARLAAGSASTVLTSDGTDISWAAASGGSTTLGAVGTYAWMSRASGSTTIQHGASIAGSTLRYAGVGQSGFNPAVAAYTTGLAGQIGTPTGTWQAMGHCTSNSSTVTPSTIFLRIS
jgi:hypothetical protein